MLTTVIGLGEAVMELRKRRKLARPALAQLMDVSPDTIVRWEREVGKTAKQQRGKGKSRLRVQQAFVDSFVAVYKKQMNAPPNITKEIHT